MAQCKITSFYELPKMDSALPRKHNSGLFDLPHKTGNLFQPQAINFQQLYHIFHRNDDEDQCSVVSPPGEASA